MVAMKVERTAPNVRFFHGAYITADEKKWMT